MSSTSIQDNLHKYVSIGYTASHKSMGSDSIDSHLSRCEPGWVKAFKTQLECLLKVGLGNFIDIDTACRVVTSSNALASVMRFALCVYVDTAANEYLCHCG